MEVKPGYKQTEVGMVPEEWDVRRLDQLTSEIGDGIHSTPEYVKSSDFYFINGNNLVDGAIQIGDTTMCVSEAEWRRLRKDLRGQSLLISINGTIGNLAYYRGEQVVLGKSAAYLNIAFDINKEYIFYSLSTSSTGKYFEGELTGTTIRNLSLQSLRNTPIPIPREPSEQRAIAGALGDVDALLGALEELIVKKRDLKHAAMQQLLTGKTRLPGFHGEWVVKTLFDLAGGKKDLFDDGDWIEAEFLSEDGVRLVQTGNIGEGVFVEKEEKKFVSEATFQKLRCKEIREGDVLICRLAEPAGRACILPRLDSYKAITAVDVTIFRPLPACANSRYLVQLFSTEKWFQTVNERCGGSTRTRISRSELGKIGIAIPPLPEQTAIAGVLTDMDAEIEALEQRLAKTRALKQGMMQELLTGRVRLI